MTPIARKRVGSHTFDDFCAIVPDGQKADLIDGVIYMASPENLEANELFLWLRRLIGDFVEENDLGKVFGSRVAFRISDKQGPEPDLAFVKKERIDRLQETYVDGPPDLAIEIVSPESAERDYKQKRKLYEGAGVAEYWIIDEELEKVTLLRLDTKGKYREVAPKKGILRSAVLPGFWLKPEWLWQDPLPKKNDVLKDILG